jgi:hypothetical protein
MQNLDAEQRHRTRELGIEFNYAANPSVMQRTIDEA